MPPPSFSSQHISQLNVPRGTTNLIKDVEQNIESLVIKGWKSLLAASLQSIESLLADPNLDLEVPDRDGLLQPDSYSAPPSSTCVSVAERLNLDLLESFSSAPNKPDAVLGMMIQVLDALAPLLYTSSTVLHWWDVLLVPILSSTDMPDAALARAIRLGASLLLKAPASAYVDVAPVPLQETESNASSSARSPAADAHEQQGPERTFVQKVFDMYMDSLSLPSTTAEADTSVSSKGDEQLTTHLGSILSLFSEYRPTAFLHHAAQSYVSPSSQAAILYLLLPFLHHKSIHIYRITSTRLLEKIIDSLIHTLSAQTMSLGIQCLVIILPHLQQWLCRQAHAIIANLLCAYTHAVCWHHSPSEHDFSSDTRMLFTSVYGLFPCTLLYFIRAPEEALTSLGYTGTLEAMDFITMQHRSTALFRCHLLHPYFAKLDHTTELTYKDHNEHDASDRMALSMSLYVPQMEVSTMDVPLPLSPGMLKDVPRSDAKTAASELHLLQNELRFELYMKEQLLMHIGRLHRDRITDAASEAEQQNLQHTIRTLQSQLSTMQTRFERQRSEMQTTSNRHAQWERELNVKLNSYREERRTWAKQIKELERQLNESRACYASQSEQVSKMGARLFELESDLALAKPKMARLADYDASLKKLQGCLSDWEYDLQRVDQQRVEMHHLLMRWQDMQLSVDNSERSVKGYSDKLAALAQEKATLQQRVDLLQIQNERLRDQMSARVSSWVATPPVQAPTRAPGVEPQLLERNKELESQVFTLRAEVEALKAEKAVRERPPEKSLPVVSEQTLFSPNTLRTPRGHAPDEESVPPLSLGPSHDGSS
ncbi:TOR signaling negative regulator [Malassezia pachydermatis]